MSTRYHVDLDALDEVIGFLQKTSDAIAGRLADLDAEIAALHGVWTGEAAAAQLRAHQEWTAGAVEMREALDALHALARTAHGNYSAAVTANLQMWG